MTEQQLPIEHVEDSNTSNNPHFNEILNAQINRRSVLRGGAGMTAAMMFGGLGLVGCGSDDDAPVASVPVTPELALPKTLDFEAVPHSLKDQVIVPEGYQVSILAPTGTPLYSSIAEWNDDGMQSGESFEFRVGDNHDGLWFFGMTDGQHDASASSRGLIALNHEYTESWMLHPFGRYAEDLNEDSLWYKKRRLTQDVRREINAHGVTIMEVARQAGSNDYELVKNSKYNRRITAATDMSIEGPAKGSNLMKTKFDATGTKARGTLNNCGSNPSPWGTYLTSEENIHAYFARGDSDKLTASEQAGLDRFGIVAGWTGWGGSGKGSVDAIDWAATVSNYLWFTPAAKDATRTDEFARWDATATAASAINDYRNEPNTFGYVVEMDPFDPMTTPAKRTALGRYSHETCTYAPVKAGEPIVFYMGDDAQGEYIYKFVSESLWDPKDAKGGMTAGDKYLNKGTLYAAKLHDDGTGEWLELSTRNSKVTSYDKVTLTSMDAICVYTRSAADAAGATRMDRPEWTAVSPVNGEVYVTLTNNSNRGKNHGTTGEATPADVANPRVPNSNGHIIRFAEKDGKHSAATFSWDVYLFASPFERESAYNLSGLTANNDMSSPDGLGFDPRGLLWIQTDDGAYTGTTNCMLLAALPGQTGDGSKLGLLNTPTGALPTEATLKRFLVGPLGCEVTGLSWSGDMKSMFVAIQHPGERGSRATAQSNWPASQTNPAATEIARSSMIVITRKDGGVIVG